VSPRTAHAVLVVGQYLYVVGDSTNTDIERASISPDGLLGSFAIVDGVTLVNRRAAATMVLVEQYIYALGGTTSGGPSNTIERTTINNDDSLEPFVIVDGLVLATSRSGHTTVIIGDLMYVLGGQHPDANGLPQPTKSIERAIINADGSLGPFTIVSSVSLVKARAGHSSAIFGSYLYVWGGGESSIERAPIRGDNSLGAFAVVSDVTLSIARIDRSAIIGNYLYALWGMDGTVHVNNVERAAINMDNSLGTFVTIPTTTLAVARAFFATAMAGNYMHVLGGDAFGGATFVTTLDSVETGQLR
jgi:hypothetical protein